MLNRNLYHPDLRSLTDAQLELRSGWWALFFPDSWRVCWYGDLIRPDGGNGMYATPVQAAAWPDRVAESSVIGPSGPPRFDGDGP